MSSHIPGITVTESWEEIPFDFIDLDAPIEDLVYNAPLHDWRQKEDSSVQPSGVNRLENDSLNDPSRFAEGRYSL